jgi:trehalose-6-phosphate synthase
VESTPSGVQYKQHSVSFEIFPLGVVVDKILAKRQSKEVVQKEAEMKELFAGKKIIVGRDKQSQIKGVLHKLLSFERFLVDYGEWHGRVVLIQITSPEHHEDRKTDVRVWEAVSRINGRFGSLDYLPVHYFNQHLDHSHYLALLAAADVGLVTCEREPLNTTAYEFILCQENGKSPLLLSELIGNAGSFSAALLIHPRDYKGVASSLHEALFMSTSDKMLRHSQLFEQACRSSVSTWGTKFLYALHQQCPNGTTQPPLTPLLNETLLLEQYRGSSSRLFLLDYDVRDGML